MNANGFAWIDCIERTMGNALILLTGILALALFWLDSARARELATQLARTLCEKRGLQFLDETVVLRRIGVRWSNNGIRFRRMFDFDFSLGGAGRRSGYLILLGTTVEQYGIDLPDEQSTVEQPLEPGEGKVVPFQRPDQKK